MKYRVTYAKNACDVKEKVGTNKVQLLTAVPKNNWYNLYYIKENASVWLEGGIKK